MNGVFAANMDGTGNGVFAAAYPGDSVTVLTLAVSTANAVALDLVATLQGICELATASLVSLVVTRIPAGTTQKTIAVATASAVSLSRTVIPGGAAAAFGYSDPLRDMVTSSTPKSDVITSRAGNDTIH